MTTTLNGIDLLEAFLLPGSDAAASDDGAAVLAPIDSRLADSTLTTLTLLLPAETPIRVELRFSRAMS